MTGIRSQIQIPTRHHGGSWAVIVACALLAGCPPEPAPVWDGSASPGTAAGATAADAGAAPGAGGPGAAGAPGAGGTVPGEVGDRPWTESFSMPLPAAGLDLAGKVGDERCCGEAGGEVEGSPLRFYIAPLDPDQHAGWLAVLGKDERPVLFGQEDSKDRKSVV